jgi:HEAT repeat protein
VQAARDELMAALDDDSAIVRITAAEAFGRYGSEADAEAATKILLDYVQPGGDYYLAVAAWNALDYLDERARPALELIQGVSTEWQAVPQRMGEYARRLKQKTLRDLE